MATYTDKQALKDWEQKVRLIESQTELLHYGTPQEQRDRKVRTKKSYKACVEYYFPHLATTEIPEWHNQIARLVKRYPEIAIWLMWGRGLAKSMLIDVLLIFWLWINDETKFFVLIGQNETKAGILLDDLKAEFEANKRIINDYGVQQNHGHWETGYFITKNGFIAKSIGMGQDPRGLRVGAFRPDTISADDWEDRFTIKNPLRQHEMAQWLLTAVLPLMDGDIQRTMLGQNKFHPTMIFDIVVQNNKGWRVHRQNAFDPVTLLPFWRDKYKDNYYIKRIEAIGILNAKAEYNNDPHIEGKIFTDEQIQWTTLPRLDHFEAIVGTWDVAYAGTPTSDYNAIRVWGLYKGNKYLIDCYVKQSKIKPALEWIASYQKNLPASVSIPFRFEAQFWNDEIYRIIDDVQVEFKLQLNLVKSERSKVKKYDRMLEMQPQYQNGRVFYSIKLMDHNDTKVGLAQLKGLEPGYKTHDDAPDADKEAFDYLDGYSRNSKHTHRVRKRENRRF